MTTLNTLIILACIGSVPFVILAYTAGFVTILPLDPNNRMLRVGLGMNNGKWFFRIDLWFFGIRLSSGIIS